MSNSLDTIINAGLKRIADPKKFVEYWLTSKRYDIDNKGSVIDMSDDGYNVDCEIEDLCYEYEQYCDMIHKAIGKFQKLHKGDSSVTDMVKTMRAVLRGKKQRNSLIDALELVKRNRVKSFINNTYKNVAYDETSNMKELEKFVRMLIKDESKFEESFLVMAHWIWGIKRKLSKRNMVYHVMPVLYGIQGTGKSTILKKMLAPVEKLTLQLSVDQAIDKASIPMLQNNFVGIFDELKGATKADINKLKSLITSDYLSTRKYYTQSVKNYLQNCSFIATTNVHIDEQIIDHTGMRRFFQINVKDNLKEYWDKFEELNYEEIFRSVDENNNRGYLEKKLDSILKYQDQMKADDPLDVFLQEYNVEAGEEVIESGDMFKVYQHWASLNNIKSTLNKQWYTKKIQKRNIKAQAQVINGKRVTFFSVDPLTKKIIQDAIKSGVYV